MAIAEGVEIHPSSFVDEPCDIGRGTKIWYFCHVSKGAKLGERCNLGQNVFVGEGVVLGANVKIQNNVSVYPGVTVEDDVFLGPSCVFTNVTNPRSQVVRRHLYEPTRVRRGASIGANATVVCGTTIGRYAFVAAGSVVTRDVPDYGLVVGVPARHVGWMSRHGHRLVPSEGRGGGPVTCRESGLRYLVEDGKCRCIDLDEGAPLPAELTRGEKSYDQLKPGA